MLKVELNTLIAFALSIDTSVVFSSFDKISFTADIRNFAFLNSFKKSIKTFLFNKSL